MRWDTRWRIIAAVMLPAMCIATALLFILGRQHLDHMRTALAGDVTQLAQGSREAAWTALRRGDTSELAAVIDVLGAHETVAVARVRDSEGKRLAAHASETSGVASTLGALLVAVTAFEHVAPAPVRLPLAPPAGTDAADVAGAVLQITPDRVWIYRGYAAIILPAAALAAALLIVAALLATVTASSVRSPLRRVTRFAQRLEAGHLDARLRTDSDGEPGDLEHAMNAMAAALRDSRHALEDQVRQTTSELRQTLQAVEVQNVELDVARKRALEASKVKSEFLANVSHEIRTPINGIVGFADLLYHSPLSAEQRDYVDTIRESCSNLLTIINDILDFSKIEAGKLAVDSIAFDLRDCVEEVLSLLAPSAYDKGLELVHLVYADVPTQLFGDPLRLRQVLTNLVHNAIKFTPAGQIVVRVMLETDGRERAELRVSVTDTGIGLREADRDKLFQAFSQADTSLTRRFGGTGLGLIISRKLIEQMGGVIGLESEPGTGSTFWFTASLLKQRAVPTPEPATPLDGRRALIFDPGELTRLAAGHQLESWGMAVEYADERCLSSQLTESGWDLLWLGIGHDDLDRGAADAAIAAARRHGIPVVALASTVNRDRLRALYHKGAMVSLPRAVRRQTVFRELCRMVASGLQPGVPDNVTALPRLPGPEHELTEPANVLVVDDNEINRKLITTIAARNGVRVVEAVDGCAAVDACRQERFDVIFMDIHMPGMSGEEASREIRTLPVAGTAPRIIALTANAMRGERERLVLSGMDDCLIKPVTEEQVLASIRQKTSSPAPGQGASDAPRDVHAQLRAMLVAELPEHRRSIRSAFRTGDLETMRERVHKLHGAVSVCRLPDLKQACVELEETLIEEDRVAVPRGMETLLRAMEDVLAVAG